MLVKLKWINAANNNEVEGRFLEITLLRFAKVRAMIMLRMFPLTPGKYEVAVAASGGDALDETKRLGELGLADGSTLYVRETVASVNLNWTCVASGQSCTEACQPDEVLRDVEVRVLPKLGLSAATQDLYGVATSPGGPELDEKQTLAALGIANEGQAVYSIDAACVTPVWMNCMNGVTCNVKCGLTLTLAEAKVRVLPDLDVPVGEAGNYFVSRDPMGAELDETKTFQELGLTANGVMLFVCQRM